MGDLIHNDHSNIYSSTVNPLYNASPL